MPRCSSASRRGRAASRRAAYRWGCARSRGGAGASPELLTDAEVGLLAALADPAGFRRIARSAGRARRRRADAFATTTATGNGICAGIAAEAPLWVTTEKDAVKILPPWVGRADVRVLRIELEVAEPDLLLDWIDSRLR